MNTQSDSNQLNQEKQILSISSILSVLAFIVASCILFGPMLMSSKDQDRQKALGKAQSMGYQIAILDSKMALQAANDSQQLASTGERMPASQAEPEASGTLGVDPWGQPYHYKIRHEGRQKVVDVWSTGENAIQTQVLIPSDTL